MSSKIRADVQVHTFELHKNPIHRYEVENICKKYHVAFSEEAVMQIVPNSIRGIKKITISPKPRVVNGKYVAPAYDLCFEVNAGKLLGYSGLSMISLSDANVEKLVRELNKVLRSLQMDDSNIDAENWYLRRFDYGIDIELCTEDVALAKEYIRLFHAAFNDGADGYYYTEYQGCENERVKGQSITIQNKSGRYNIYAKLYQALKEYKRKMRPEEIEEMKFKIRIEKQQGVIETDASINSKGLSNAFGKDNSKVLGNLGGEVSEKMMNSIIRDMNLLFGSGDFVPLQDGLQIIRNSKKYVKDKPFMELLYYRVNRCSSYKQAVDSIVNDYVNYGHINGQDEIQEFVKEINAIRKKIESLGISVVASKTGVRMDGIDKLIQSELTKNKKPRKKGAFCELKYVPKAKRYQSNPTVYLPYGKSKRKTLYGDVGDDYDTSDLKALKQLIKYYVDCVNSIRNDEEELKKYLEIAKLELQRYKKLKHCQKVLDTIDFATQIFNKKVSELEGGVSPW